MGESWTWHAHKGVTWHHRNGIRIHQTWTTRGQHFTVGFGVGYETYEVVFPRMSLKIPDISTFCQVQFRSKYYTEKTCFYFLRWVKYPCRLLTGFPYYFIFGYCYHFFTSVGTSQGTFLITNMFRLNVALIKCSISHGLHLKGWILLPHYHTYH